jgi:hypothetical protein
LPVVMNPIEKRLNMRRIDTKDDCFEMIKLIRALFGIDYKFKTLDMPYVAGMNFPIGLN